MSSWPKILKATVAFDTACSFVRGEGAGDEEELLAGGTEQPEIRASPKSPATRGGWKTPLVPGSHVDAPLADTLLVRIPAMLLTVDPLCRSAWKGSGGAFEA